MVAPFITRTFHLNLPVASSSTTVSPRTGVKPIAHEAAFAVWTTGDPPLEGEARGLLQAFEMAAAADTRPFTEGSAVVVEGSLHAPAELPTVKKQTPGRIVVLSLAHCNWQPVLGPDLKCFGAAVASLAHTLLQQQVRSLNKSRGAPSDERGLSSHESFRGREQPGDTDGALEAAALESMLEAAARASVAGWAEVTAAKMAAEAAAEAQQAQAAAEAERAAKAAEVSAAEQRFADLFSSATTTSSGGAPSELLEGDGNALNDSSQSGSRDSSPHFHGEGDSGRPRESTYHEERTDTSAAAQRALLDQAPSVEELEQSLCSPSPESGRGDGSGGGGIARDKVRSAEKPPTTIALAPSHDRSAANSRAAASSSTTQEAAAANTAMERSTAGAPASAPPSLAAGGGVEAGREAGAATTTTTTVAAKCRVERLRGSSVGGPATQRPCCVCGNFVLSCCSNCVDLSHEEIALCTVPHVRGAQSCFETFHCLGTSN